MDKKNLTSLEFKEMIQGCLAFNPKERYSIDDLKNCNFMKKNIDKESALKDMKSRVKKVKQIKTQAQN